jgi:hypothetical protein
MGIVIMLTPVVIGGWPIIAASAAAAASTLGMAVSSTLDEQRAEKSLAARENAAENSVQIELEQGSVPKDFSSPQEITMHKDGISIHLRRDNKGRCSICAEGKGCSDSQLEIAAQQFRDKFVQSYAYNRTVSELKQRNFQMIDEQVEEDGSIRLHVRLWND